MRRNLTPNSAFYPEPVCIIATYDSKGNPNAMNAAWGGISDTNEIGLCLSANHLTTKNILKNKCFTVSCGTKDTCIACDYVGMVSGNKVKNKLEKCGFNTIKAAKVNAPIIEELPFALECELKSYDKKTGHLFAKIVNISVDSKVMTRGKVDIKKLQPIIFDGMNHTYNIIGEKIADAFKVYKKIK